MTRAILYDLDGTLLNIETALVAARRAALRELLARPPARGAELCFRRIRRRFVLADYTDVLRGVALELGADPRRAARADRVLIRTVTRRARWYPGARPTLLELRRRGLTLGLISTGLARYQRPKIRRLGIAPLFAPHLYVSGELGADAAKPATAMFRAFLRRSRLRPAQVIMVGNQVEDILGAHLAGIRAALFAPAGRLYPIRSRLERPDWTLARHRDILKLLESGRSTAS